MYDITSTGKDPTSQSSGQVMMLDALEELVTYPKALDLLVDRGVVAALTKVMKKHVSPEVHVYGTRLMKTISHIKHLYGYEYIWEQEELVQALVDSFNIFSENITTVSIINK